MYGSVGRPLCALRCLKIPPLRDNQAAILRNIGQVVVLHYSRRSSKQIKVTQLCGVHVSRSRSRIAAEVPVSLQNPAMSLEFANARVGAWRSRTLAVVLMVIIGSVF